MVWSDLRYDDETMHPFGRPRRRDTVAPDTALFRLYRELIALRKQHLRLFVDGSMNWLRTYDAPGLLAYERVRGDQRAIVAFNVSAAPVEASFAADGSYRVASPAGGGTTVTSGELRTQLPPRAARVWIRE
jgi:glycosidase